MGPWDYIHTYTGIFLQNFFQVSFEKYARPHKNSKSIIKNMPKQQAVI